MDDLTHYCCLNPACKDHGRRGGDNLAVAYRNGAQKQSRVLVCRTCKVRFSESKGTPFYRSHLPRAKVISLLEHLDEGCGVRQTGRLVKAHRDTVMRYGRLAGDQARDAHDELVAFSPEHPRGPVR